MKKNNMIHIVKKRKIFFAISSVMVLLSIISLIVFGLKPGIDFTGGSLIEVSFTQKRPNLEAMNASFQDQNLGSVRVQPTGDKGYILKMRFITEEEHQGILLALREKFETIDEEEFQDAGFEIIDEETNVLEDVVVNLDLDEKINDSAENNVVAHVENKMLEERIETIGPAISSQLKKRSIEAAIAVVLAIIVYIAYAFRKVSKPVRSWKYGVTAIVALFHDVVITMGVFAILGRYAGVEVDIPFVVAMLTILGYSVNDTIVVFDRVRENLIKIGYDKFAEVVNKGVNETLVRSVNTSVTTLIVLLALFLFGGETIHYFSLALIIGILFGTYSSIFLASPLLVVWKNFGDKK